MLRDPTLLCLPRYLPKHLFYPGWALRQESLESSKELWHRLHLLLVLLELRLFQSLVAHHSNPCSRVSAETAVDNCPWLFLVASQCSNKELRSQLNSSH